MQKKTVMNPYLPLSTYIPDGEPHIFGDRVYVYGSRDKEAGEYFCLLDYQVWSAPVDDLSDWRCEGVSYRAKQDPTWSPTRNYVMFAPDCVRGNDGRYYLYYAMAGGHFTGPIHVAVSDNPTGPFEYYGCVRNPDGSDMTTFITFDPAVINDDGVIRLYYGWSFTAEGCDPATITREELWAREMPFFEKTRAELEATPEDIMGGNTVELEDDMLTIRHRPRRIVPGPFASAGTSFEGHAFFEASSIRKIGKKYYYVYSSEHLHELCYATSDYPDRDFVYGGVIVSNGDIGYHGRKPEDRLAMTGNNHGGMVEVNGQWYIFYHRQTHMHAFSRQGCAEKITIDADGRISQVEMTSCGLNDGPLPTRGVYAAAYACNLTNGHMDIVPEKPPKEPTPYITNDGEERFITGMAAGSLAVWKYFDFSFPCKLIVKLRGSASGSLVVETGDIRQGELLLAPSDAWVEHALPLAPVGIRPLTLRFEGEGVMELLEIRFV